MIDGRTSGGRYTFAEPISSDEIDRVLADPRAYVVQTDQPVSRATWRLLNDALFAVRPEIEARVFGHYRVTCDLGFLEVLPNLTRFSADCLHGDVVGFESLGHLPRLQALSIGCWSLTSLDFLGGVPGSLRELSIGDTKSRAVRLGPLERFAALRKLAVEGRHKELGVISSLRSLEELTLRSVSVPDLRWICTLPKLHSLDLKLGGVRDLGALGEMQALRYLAVWQVRGVAAMDEVARLSRLQFLFLQSLPHVHQLPMLDALSRLRRIVLGNMSGLHDFSFLESAPALEEFGLFDGRRNRPEELAPLWRNPHVKRAMGGFGSVRRDEEFVRTRTLHGVERFNMYSPFRFEHEAEAHGTS